MKTISKTIGIITLIAWVFALTVLSPAIAIAKSNIWFSLLMTVLMLIPIFAITIFLFRGKTKAILISFVLTIIILWLPIIKPLIA